MGAHTLMCSFTVMKSVGFCQTLFYSKSDTNGIFLKSWLPTWSFPAYYPGQKHSCHTSAGPASPGQVGTFAFPACGGSTASWQRFCSRVLEVPSRKSYGDVQATGSPRSCVDEWQGMGLPEASNLGSWFCRSFVICLSAQTTASWREGLFCHLHRGDAALGWPPGC